MYLDEICQKWNTFRKLTFLTSRLGTSWREKADGMEMGGGEQEVRRRDSEKKYQS